MVAQDAANSDRLAFMRVRLTGSVCRWMLVICASFCALIAASPLRPCCCGNTSATGGHRDMLCCRSESGTPSNDESDNAPRTCPPLKCPCKIQSTSAIKPEIIVSLPANDQIVKWLHLQIGWPTHTFRGITDVPLVCINSGASLPYTARDNCVSLCRFLC